MSNLRLVENNPQSQSTSIDAKYPLAITATLNKVAELKGITNKWDGYDALSPTKDALIGAVALAVELFEEGTPIPDVFPVPNGNIQFEWSCFELDLEIEITSNRRLTACFDDLQSGNSWEKVFTFDLTELRKIIERLTSKNKSKNIRQVVNG